MCAGPHDDACAVLLGEDGAVPLGRFGRAAWRWFEFDIEVRMVGVNVPIPVPIAAYSFGGWKDSFFGDTQP